MQLKHKLVLALLAYGAIAILAWQTLSEVKLRAFVWLVMGLFAAKSLLFWYSHRELPVASRRQEQSPAGDEQLTVTEWRKDEGGTRNAERAT
jgi:hypothetical protein